MNHKVYIWCLHCEQCFPVLLSRPPAEDEGAINFGGDLEMQLGVEQNGQIYAECLYDHCDGGLLDFWWWDEYRNYHPDSPEVPEEDKVYPLYPEHEQQLAR